MINQRTLHRSHSAKLQTAPSTSLITKDCLNTKPSSSLPQAFISSLRQLFSILDKTNCGYVPFNVFKRYFDCSSSTPDFLDQLEIESQSNNHLITFDLLIKVIERSLMAIKSAASIATTKVTRPLLMCPLNRSTSVTTVTPREKDFERTMSFVHRSPVRLEVVDFDLASSGNMKKKIQRNDNVTLSMMRSLKQYETERNLLIQTCDVLDRVKLYLTDSLLEMKDKRKSYCRYLSTAEGTGITPKPMYNRDLVADLFKLANAVLEQKSSDLSTHSSFSSQIQKANNQYKKQLKAKDDYIRQLEAEKSILLKERKAIGHQHGSMIPTKLP